MALELFKVYQNVCKNNDLTIVSITKVPYETKNNLNHETKYHKYFYKICTWRKFFMFAPTSNLNFEKKCNETVYVSHPIYKLI